MSDSFADVIDNNSMVHIKRPSSKEFFAIPLAQRLRSNWWRPWRAFVAPKPLTYGVYLVTGHNTEVTKGNGGCLYE